MFKAYYLYDNFYIELYHILSIIILIAINFTIYLKAKKTPLLYQYLVVVSILLLWLVAKIFKTVSPNQAIRWSFIVMQFLGSCFLGSAFFIFAYTYATGRPMRRKYALWVNIVPALSVLMVITNPYHMLWYSSYTFWDDKWGPAFYISMVYTEICLISGLILCARNFRSQFKEKRMQSRLFVIAILAPLIVNLLYGLQLYQPLFHYRPPFDPTPVTCNISLFMFAIASFKYRFLDILPIARRKALEQIAEGILLYDAKGRIIDFNQTFWRLTSWNPSMKRGQSIGSLAEDLKSLYGAPLDQPLMINLASHDPGQSYNYTCKTRDGSYFKLVVQPLRKRRHSIGAALRFIDTTFQNQAIQSLTQKNEALNEANQRLEERARLIRELTVNKIRSFAAREVHDILGHSVVLVISLLEVGLLSINNKADEVNNKINQAIVILNESLQELENIITAQNPVKIKNHNLLNALTLMIEEAKASGREIELTVQGLVNELPSLHVENTYRVCQEGITNAIRHGNATQINIFLRFSTHGYEIYILDNGAGCEKITKGHGILGMEERVNKLNGQIKYGSNENAGFTIHIAIPFVQGLLPPLNDPVF